MEIIIYRHEEPRVSSNEIISGHDFPLWVQRYNESGICINEFSGEKEVVVYTSDLARSLETGRCESFREARRRARKIVERIELQLLENERIVIVGHGFLRAYL